ncbi:hypothetical protein SLS63_014071 [Diaporthe eres]|uniref:Cytochrome P450 n=1 Tax=Diaporthe eres TaxID=83184 RepID=A0ABR1NLP9_DIAER
MGTERPNIFNEPDREAHRKKRRVIGFGISERAMRVFEPEMAQEVDVFLGQLLRSSQNQETVDMTPFCERLGVDIIGQLAFGFQLNSQRDPTHRPVSAGMRARSRLGSLYMAWPALRYMDPIITRLSPVKYKNDMRSLYKSLRTMIGARMALPKDAKPDFYAHVSGDIAPGDPGLDTKDLWAEAILIVAAGGSTTATTITAALFYLSRNPEVYERLASEIRNHFSSAKDIKQGPQLSACSYLRAVIDESLRLSTGTISNWRVQDPSSVAAGEQLVVDGHVIPPGTEVAINAYSFMRNPDYYPDPFAFRPERWLAEDGETLRGSSDIVRRAFVPFSIGSRSCAGQAMAYLELNLAIARTMWYFDFEKAPGEAGKLGEVPGQPLVFKLEDSTIVGHHGPNLVFKPRGNYWRELMKHVD